MDHSRCHIGEILLQILAGVDEDLEGHVRDGVVLLLEHGDELIEAGVAPEGTGEYRGQGLPAGGATNRDNFKTEVSGR